MAKVKRYQTNSYHDYNARINCQEINALVACTEQSNNLVDVHYRTKCFNVSTAIKRFFNALDHAETTDKFQPQLLGAACNPVNYCGFDRDTNSYFFSVQYNMAIDAWEIEFQLDLEKYANPMDERVDGVFHVSMFSWLDIRYPDNANGDYIEYRYRYSDNDLIPAWRRVKLYSKADGDMYFKWQGKRIHLSDCFRCYFT